MGIIPSMHGEYVMLNRQAGMKSTREMSGFYVGWGGLKAPKRPEAIRLPSAQWNQWFTSSSKLIRPDQNRVFPLGKR
jgi:hypothetical protein